MHSGCVSKCFVYKRWVGDQPTSRKIAGKNLKKIYLKTILRGSWLGKYPLLFTSTSVNYCSLYIGQWGQSKKAMWTRLNRNRTGIGYNDLPTFRSTFLWKCPSRAISSFLVPNQIQISLNKGFCPLTNCSLTPEKMNNISFENVLKYVDIIFQVETRKRIRIRNRARVWINVRIRVKSATSHGKPTFHLVLRIF